MAQSLVMGICVGGRGRRMGGVQKALLLAPDTGESLIARTLRLGREAGHELVLLGAAELGAAVSGVMQLPDAADIGPLAALQSLLAYAGERDALCMACDMPFVSAGLLRRLAGEESGLGLGLGLGLDENEKTAEVVAARDAQTGKWEAMFARYRSAAVAPLLERVLAEGERSFQGLFARLTVRELCLSPDERVQLRDWDTPEDMRTQR
jgi:molybdopterin-guanine dinucleotide biosynthesis protein A